MDRVHIFNFEVEADKFEHFLKGDGEIYFDNYDGVFLTEEELTQAFKDNNCETEDDQAAYCKEFDILQSYNELDTALDYFYGGNYDLTYLKIGKTVVMSMAYEM